MQSLQSLWSWTRLRWPAAATAWVLVWMCSPSPTFAAPADAELSLAQQLSAAALERTQHSVRYDGRYLRLDYPGGDVPADIGVCTDVLVRAFRALGVDLQRLVHEDMQRAFASYPPLWGLERPDANIDHRRVPNLEHFLTRQGVALPVSDRAADYRPGDIVSWRLDSGLPHIGVVVDRRAPDTDRYLIVHNIGAGPELEDVLFAYSINGHFRWLPEALSE